MRLRGLALLLCLGGSLSGDEAQRFRIVIDAAGAHRPAHDADAGEPDTAARNATDRAENGSFDASEKLRAWSRYEYGAGSGTADWVSEDSGGAPGSGSVLLTNTSPADGPRESGLQQCVRPSRPLHGLGRLFATRFRLRVPPHQAVGEGSYAAAAAIFFTSEDCSSGFVAGGGVASLLAPEGTPGWQDVNPDWLPGTEFFVPGGSVLLSVTLHKADGVAEPLQVYVDDVGLRGSWEAAKGDLNHDGETDLVLRDGQTGEQQVWFLRDERRLGRAVALVPAPEPGWHVAGVDDFDSDGLQDLLMWNAETGASEFWLMNGTTRVGAPVPVEHPLPLPWKPVATADFDGDGQTDLLYRYATPDKLAKQRLLVWILKGTSHTATLVPNPDHAVNFNWEVVAARDMDGDDHTDLLWFNRHSGRVVCWFLDDALNRKTGGFSNPDRAGDSSWKLVAGGDFGIGPQGRLAAVADSIDLLWRNARTGRLAVWFMDRQLNRTGGRLVTPDPPPAAAGWAVDGPR